FLGINPNARKIATATPTPVPIRAKVDSKAGAELDALLAPTATPTLSPTPLVMDRPREEAKGIFGSLRSFFGFGKKEEKKAEEGGEVKKEKPGGILKRFFSIFGVEDEDKPADTPEDPTAVPGEDP